MNGTIHKATCRRADLSGRLHDIHDSVEFKAIRYVSANLNGNKSDISNN